MRHLFEVPLVGARIKLVDMSEDPDPIPNGTKGTVLSVHNDPDFTQIHVAWDNGRVLGLIPGTDRWEVV